MKWLKCVEYYAKSFIGTNCVSYSAKTAASCVLSDITACPWCLHLWVWVVGDAVQNISGTDVLDVSLLWHSFTSRSFFWRGDVTWTQRPTCCLTDYLTVDELCSLPVICCGTSIPKHETHHSVGVCIPLSLNDVSQVKNESRILITSYIVAVGSENTSKFSKLNDTQRLMTLPQLHLIFWAV